MHIRLVHHLLLSQKTKTVGVTATKKTLREDTEMRIKVTASTKMAADNRR